MPKPNEDFLTRARGKEFLAGNEISSINSEKRAVDCVFFTGIDVPRVDWWTGKKYTLRFDPKGADFSYLNNGAPIFDNHSSYDGSVSQKGKVEKAWTDGKDHKATLRFSKRKSVDELWGDVEDGIVTKFSMGVEILESETIKEKGQEVRLAKRWRPFEISIAPIPADFGTTTLSAEESEEITMGTSPEGEQMSAQVPGTGAQNSTEVTASNEQLSAARDVGATAERARVIRINDVCDRLRLSSEFRKKHIDSGTPVEVFNAAVIDEEHRRADEFVDIGAGRTHVKMLRDEVETRRKLMSESLLGLMNPDDKVEDSQNPFLGLSLKQIAQESVRLHMGTYGVPKDDTMVRMAMQVTSDFAAVLENTSRKQMLNGYAYAQPTYRVWTKKSTTPDFKTMTRTRLSETPSFLKVPEGAQITIGTMLDSKESYALSTYGRGISFSRQMLINDDLGAFNNLVFQFGVQAARLENKTVYAILNANGNMADSVALFHGTHANLGTGVIANTALDAMFTAMKTQKGLDGASILNISPKYLIVPAAKEATARAAVMLIGPNVKASDQNWFAGRLEVVADAELDGTSTVVWYGVADPGIAPGIEACFLQGQEGPQFIRKENENGILGIQFYAFEDFAAKAVDFRPMYKSSGS